MLALRSFLLADNELSGNLPDSIGPPRLDQSRLGAASAGRRARLCACGGNHIARWQVELANAPGGHPPAGRGDAAAARLRSRTTHEVPTPAPEPRSWAKTGPGRIRSSHGPPGAGLAWPRRRLPPPGRSGIEIHRHGQALLWLPGAHLNVVTHSAKHTRLPRPNPSCWCKALCERF